MFLESSKNTPTFPKTIPKLTPEQQEAREKWMTLWHEVLPNKFGMVEAFNHGFPVKLGLPKDKKLKTLEVGAGLGEHVKWEDLSHQEYQLLEYRAEWCERLRKIFPHLPVIHGDIQKKLDHPDASFDRVIAIHVLEHLPDLPKALNEIHRLLKSDGFFDIVIPCEGGPAYEVARQLTSARMFKKHFKMDYMPIMRAEHINTCGEIIECLKEAGFKVQNSQYFPLLIPIWQFNLCLGFRLKKN